MKDNEPTPSAKDTNPSAMEKGEIMRLLHSASAELETHFDLGWKYNYVMAVRSLQSRIEELSSDNKRLKEYLSLQRVCPECNKTLPVLSLPSGIEELSTENKRLMAEHKAMKEILQKCSIALCPADLGGIPIVTLGQKTAKTIVDDFLSLL